MKKMMFLSAVGITMMFAACSNDDATPAEQPVDGTAASEIALVLNSGGDGMGVRTDRPVYSSEAANNVKYAKIVIYNPSGTDVTSTVLLTGISNPISWTAGPNDAVAPGDSPSPAHKATQTIKLKKLATDGTYTVVAYGYNEVADYTITGGTSAADSYTATQEAGNTSEFFAGKSTFVVTNGAISSNTKCEVELKRQVAGMLGYFKNIPVVYPDPTTGVATAVKYVRVYASAQSTAFTFPSIKNVNAATGATTNGATKVLEYNLSTLIPDYSTQVTAAGTDLSVPFTIAAQTGATLTLANSILKGRFLIPFAYVSGNTTFTIQLESAENPTNTIVLKKWDVVNEAVGEDGEDGAEEVKERVYNVQRNYFYSIGKKLKGNTTNGNGTTPDQPIDLSRETVIAITVNDAWDVIYDLGIE